MKILTKRAIATVIDIIVLITIIELILLYIYNGNLSDMSILRHVWLFLVCFGMKDAIFKNASIGKKILGIAIYRKNLSKPTRNETIIRTSKMTFIGAFILLKCLIAKSSLLSFFEWEKNELNTMVIDNDTFCLIQSKASEENNDLSIAYNEYLKSIYR